MKWFLSRQKLDGSIVLCVCVLCLHVCLCITSFSVWSWNSQPDKSWKCVPKSLLNRQSVVLNNWSSHYCGTHCASYSFQNPFYFVNGVLYSINELIIQYAAPRRSNKDFKHSATLSADKASFNKSCVKLFLKRHSKSYRMFQNYLLEGIMYLNVICNIFFIVQWRLSQKSLKENFRWWLIKECGAMYKECGAIYKEWGAIYKECGAIYKECGAIYKEWGAICRSTMNNFT